MRVLVTGMSGAGKSTLVSQLRRRGYEAYDADDHGFSEPHEDGRWGWRVEMVSELLASCGDRLIFVAGCSEEQAAFSFDVRVLLSAPTAVLVDRLRMRTNNSYGREACERAQVLADLVEVEPLLRESADLVLSTTLPPHQVADQTRLPRRAVPSTLERVTPLLRTAQAGQSRAPALMSTARRQEQSCDRNRPHTSYPPAEGSAARA